jgi:hypothetical protein
VALTGHGVECSCPDYIFNRAGEDPVGLGRCKHIAALQDWDLLRAPAKSRPPVIPLPLAPSWPALRPTAELLEELLAGMPPAEPMTPQGINEMADCLLPKRAHGAVR